MSIRSLSIIGAGNLGYHLGQRFFKKGYEVKDIFSRKIEKAEIAASKINAFAINDLKKLSQHSDLYVLAVKDDSISIVARELANIIGHTSFVVHTSGTVYSKALGEFFPRHGVFYPPQTFSIQKEANFEEIPFCVEAATEEDLNDLMELANDIGKQGYHLNDQDREILHLGAVIVNNFTNHLFEIASRILTEKGVSFDLLKPLILETALKVQSQDPGEAQTGPAAREDRATIERHLALLERYFPNYTNLYKEFSERIIKSRNAH